MVTKRGLGYISLFAILILLGGIGSAYAQVQQATLKPKAGTTWDNLSVGSDVYATLEYNSSDTTVTVFGVRVHYNSSILVYVDSEVLHSGGATGPVSDKPETDELKDEDDNTDRMLVIGYGDPFGGSWPNVDLPLDLATFHFQVKAETNTSLNFAGAKTASGFTFEGTDATISFGGVVPTYDVTFNISGNGYLNTDGNDQPVVHTVNEGADCPTVTAIAMPDNEFVNWTDAAEAEVSIDPALTITNVQAPATYTANFKASTDPCAGTAACIDSPPAQIQVGVSSDWSATCSTAATGDGIIAWAWTFRDGAGTLIGTAQGESINFKAINYVYTNATVDLEITTTNGCKNTITHTFNVVDEVPPTCNVSFIAHNNGNLTATFTLTGDTDVNLMYDFGDDTTGAATPGQADTIHDYTNTGGAKTYTVKLTGTDPVSNQVCGTAETQVEVTGGTVTPDGDISVPADGADIFDALVAAMYSVCGDNAQCKADLETKYPGLVAHLDVYNTGDGVTIMDALAIAKYDVGLTCDCALDKLTK